MSLPINVFLLIFGFIGTLAAFGGETWRKTDEPLLKRITKRGWTSLSCLLLALTLGIVKEFRTNRLSAIESEKRNNLQKQLSQTEAQLTFSNNRLRDISSQVNEIPRQAHSEYISLNARGIHRLRTRLYGGDEFRYSIPCEGLYLATGFSTSYLRPGNHGIIILGRRGVAMEASIISRSRNPCILKGNVYSIVRRTSSN